MGWVRLDDGLADHPKTLAAWEEDPASLGLLVRALSYCGKHETDGHVPDVLLRSWLPRKSTRDRLIGILERHGFLEPDDDGWLIHDYLDRNPSKAEKDQEREEARERMKKARAGKKRRSRS